jgi:hypothetical protein
VIDRADIESLDATVTIVALLAETAGGDGGRLSRLPPGSIPAGVTSEAGKSKRPATA